MVNPILEVADVHRREGAAASISSEDLENRRVARSILIARVNDGIHGDELPVRREGLVVGVGDAMTALSHIILKIGDVSDCAIQGVEGEGVKGNLIGPRRIGRCQSDQCPVARPNRIGQIRERRRDRVVASSVSVYCAQVERRAVERRVQDLRLGGTACGEGN